MYCASLGSGLSRNRRSDYWKFEEHMTETLVYSKAIIIAMQLAEGLDEDKISAIHNVLKTVPAPCNGGFDPKWRENFNCRTWAKEALDTRKRKGLLSFTSVEDLEQEAINAAMAASSRGRAKLEVSKFTGTDCKDTACLLHRF